MSSVKRTSPIQAWFCVQDITIVLSSIEEIAEFMVLNPGFDKWIPLQGMKVEEIE